MNKKICFSNIDRILKQKPDIAIIASTSDSHLKLIKNCANHGIKKIMVEKPLTNSLINCKKLEVLSKNKKIKICVNHSYRFSNQFVYLKNKLNSKKLGKIISINYLCGNLGISMNGTHFFDFFKFLTTSEIFKLRSNINIDKNINPRGSKFNDFEGQISMWNKDGSRGYIDASNKSYHGETLTCICKYGVFFIDLLTGNTTINYRKPTYRKSPSNQYARPYILKREKIKIDGVLTMTKINLKKFLNDKDYVTLKDGIYPIKILIAAISSSKRKNSEVKINNLKNTKGFSWA